MSTARSYDDPCGVARALDLIGERWALLVVRELLLGPKRFGDLRAGLPTASQNVLSHRLRELEAAQVVRRRRLGPPASSWVYELTDRGRGLEPVLLALGTWGSRTPLTSSAPLSVDALMLALRTAFEPERATRIRASYQLRLGADSFHARIADGRLDLERGEAPEPEAVLETDAQTLRQLVFGGRRIADAVRHKALVLHGDRRAVDRFVALFPRPVPDGAGG